MIGSDNVPVLPSMLRALRPKTSADHAFLLCRIVHQHPYEDAVQDHPQLMSRDSRRCLLITIEYSSSKFPMGSLGSTRAGINPVLAKLAQEHWELVMSVRSVYTKQ